MEGQAAAAGDEQTAATGGGQAAAAGDERALVERARTGDGAAFSALVRRYQEMALGYALALLRDYHLAQDIAQESLFSAYRSLASLEDGARFPAWLRGIVRFQCGRVLRRRRLELTPLDHACDVAEALSGPEQRLDVQEGFHRILTVINTLPEAQREVAMLFYIKDYSQRRLARCTGGVIAARCPHLPVGRSGPERHLACRRSAALHLASAGPGHHRAGALRRGPRRP